MTAIGVTEQPGGTASPLRRTSALRQVLLICGVLSSILYAGMTVLVPMRWDGYSSTSQAISELSAIGAPTRALWVPLGFAYMVLVCAFGWGVVKSAGPSRALRVVGWSIFAFGALGLLWPFAPMHLRETLAAGGETARDTMHLVLAGVTVLLMVVAVGTTSVAFGRGFRFYSVATLVIVVLFGILTGLDAPNVKANRPTPFEGVWERISLGGFLLWIVVLAIALLRAHRPLSEDS